MSEDKRVEQASGTYIEIIKKKELYTMMESFSDYCEDVADILEGLIMRNS